MPETSGSSCAAVFIASIVPEMESFVDVDLIAGVFHYGKSIMDLCDSSGRALLIPRIPGSGRRRAVRLCRVVVVVRGR